MRIILFLTIFFLPIIATAQTDTVKGQFAYNYENDFFTATDRYYTQGITPELIHPVFRKLPTRKILFTLKESTQKMYGISAQQICYTPRSIRYDTIKVGERPYSASMFISPFVISMNEKRKIRLRSKIDIGAMGPCAVCEQEQKGIHRVLKNIQPLGWEYQLKNHVILNYTLGFEKGILMDEHFEFIGLSQFRIGTQWNDVGIGSMIRFGKMNGYFKSYGLVAQKSTRFQCYFFMKGMASLVGYNATLQGGMFNHSDIYSLHANQVTRVVGTVNGGIVITSKKFGVGYTLYSISPEFTNGLFHAWGLCNLTFGF